jgi:hypothetical protein
MSSIATPPFETVRLKRRWGIWPISRPLEVLGKIHHAQAQLVAGADHDVRHGIRFQVSAIDGT